jgi:hypothetical protein
MAAEEAIDAIFRAASEGDAVSVARMLDEDPRLVSSWWGRDTLLTMAAWKGHVDVVTLLLERGADINQTDEYGNTALHVATCGGHEEMVSFLITSGADLSRKGLQGQTALVSASWRSHVAVVRLLLRAMGGRGLNEREGGGGTALWNLCRNGHADGVRALLLAGADHTIADNDDRTPLQIAEERGHHECVALIQVSTSLVSRSQGHHDGTVFAVCDACVAWARTSQSVPVLQWWEGELQRAYVLHKARTLHEDTATRQQAPAAHVPAYLSRRVQGGKRLPQVQIQASGGNGGRRTRGAARTIAERGGEEKDEEVCAMVGFVVRELDGHLYIELLAGLKLR